MVVFIEMFIGLVAIVAVFSIPLAWSPLGKALAESIRHRGADPRVPELESRVKALEKELHQIREVLVLGPGGPAQ